METMVPDKAVPTGTHLPWKPFPPVSITMNPGLLCPPLCRPWRISEGLVAFTSAQPLPHTTAAVLIIQFRLLKGHKLFLLEEIWRQNMKKLESYSLILSPF